MELAFPLAGKSSLPGTQSSQSWSRRAGEETLVIVLEAGQGSEVQSPSYHL